MKNSKGKDYTTSFLVDQSPEEVFKAVSDVRAWWSDDIDGDTDRLSAEFTFRHKDIHRSTHKITEFVSGKRVVWHTTKGYLSFVADKSEWAGTDIVFDIAKKGAKTELRFTHVGLVPRLECFGDCSKGWGFYINESLRDLIVTGKGQPERKAA